MLTTYFIDILLLIIKKEAIYWQKCFQQASVAFFLLKDSKVVIFKFRKTSTVYVTICIRIFA